MSRSSSSFPRMTAKPQLISLASLDSLSAQARSSARRRKNYNFHAETDLANRLLNAVEPGSYVQPHRHLDPSKDETLVVVRGSFGVVFFDDSGTVTADCGRESRRGRARRGHSARRVPLGRCTGARLGLLRGQGRPLRADQGRRAGTVGAEGKRARGRCISRATGAIVPLTVRPTANARSDRTRRRPRSHPPMRRAPQAALAAPTRGF